MLMVAMRWQNNMEQLASLLRMFAIIAATSEKNGGGPAGKHNKGATRLQDVSRFMVNNYQRPISLDEVAKYAGMNRSSSVRFSNGERQVVFHGFERIPGGLFCLMLAGNGPSDCRCLLCGRLQ